MRLRRPKGQRKSICSKCESEARKGQRYCNAHHAEYMKEFRLKQKQNTND